VANVLTPEFESVRLLYIYGATVCVPPLQFTVPVDAVKVPPDERVPSRLRVPASEKVSLACAAVPENVIFPVIVMVPVETDTVQNRPEVELPGMVMLAALNVPVPTAIVLVIVPVDGEFIVIAPETVSVLVPLIDIPLFVVGAFIVIEAHVALQSTVTAIPLLIITASADVGTDCPPHVAVELQLPVTLAVLCARTNDTVNNSVITIIHNIVLVVFILIYV